MKEEEENNASHEDSNQSQEKAEAGNYQEGAVEGIRNLTFNENENMTHEDKCNGDEGEFQKGKIYEHPLRPHAKDCELFLRTGFCRFGLFCKFNHPLGRVFQGDQNQKAWTSEPTAQIECKFYQTPEGCKYGKDCWYIHPKEKSDSEPPESNDMTEEDNFMEQKGQIECKYHLTSRGCKYGNDCRYSHSKQNSFLFMEKSKMPSPELNFLGLPIRKLEKECPFYMRTGTCGYGVTCRYNHPDPTAAGGSKIPGLDGNFLENLNQVSPSFSSLDTLETARTSGSSNKLNQDKTLAWLDSCSLFAHDIRNSGSTYEQNGNTCSALAMMDGTNTTETYRPYQMNTHEEFPKRPGEPNCGYFMRTGTCKYKSACKFHHPEIQASSSLSSYGLSSMGLPLRPGRRICWHYERSGECEHGVLCLFNHPEALRPQVPF